MLAMFWPSIQRFIDENRDHEHARQWSTWMEQGLTKTSDLGFVKQILHTDTLDQLFVFFRDSPALVDTFDIVWDHKINYCP
jgi:hypothetical protein